MIRSGCSGQYSTLKFFFFKIHEYSSLMQDVGVILNFFLKKGVGQTLGEMGTLNM